MRRMPRGGAAVVVLFCLCCFGASQEAPGVLVTGRVVDDQSQPVAGAEVVAYEQQYRKREFFVKAVHPATKTDQAGRFEMRVVADDPGSTLVVRKSGLAFAWDRLNRCTEGKTRLLLVLAKPCTLTGTVVDTQGRPVAGAAVQAVPKTSYLSRLRQQPIIAPAEWFTVETDDDGMFRFDAFEADVSCDGTACE